MHTYICAEEEVYVYANLNPGDSGDAQQGLRSHYKDSLRRLQREGSRGGRTGQQLHLVNLT